MLLTMKCAALKVFRVFGALLILYSLDATPVETRSEGDKKKFYVIIKRFLDGRIWFGVVVWR